VRYAQDRHMPDGKWVQTTLSESIVGVQSPNLVDIESLCMFTRFRPMGL
jgi:hypothetical protein